MTTVQKQECIPVGCVPPAAVAVSSGWGVSASGGVWPGGLSGPVGCLPRGCLPRGCLPRGCLPRGVCPGGVCPGGCLPRRVSAWRGCLPGGGCLPGVSA